jgi:hypothetical protein
MADDPKETIEKLVAEIYEKGSSAPLRLLRVENALVVLRAYLKIASQDDRLAVWEYLQGGYCTHCGDDDPRCQCWNDE